MERLLHFFERYPLDLLAHLSSLLPILVGFRRIDLLKPGIKFVWLFFIFHFLKDTYALIYMFIVPNNLFLQNIEPIIESILLGFIFVNCYENPAHKRLITSFTLVCTLVTLAAYKSEEVSSISLSAFRLLAITLSLSYFNKVLTDMRVKRITKHTMFWFVAGLLIYSSGTFFIVLFSEYWYKDINKVPAEIFDKYWNASQILYMLFCFISALGLWVSKYDQENLAW